MDIHILFPLLDRIKDINYIQNESYERLLMILKNHSQANELQNAIMWFDSEKSKVLSNLKKDGQKLVNEDAVLEDYFEKKENKVQNKLMSLFGG